MTGRRLFAASAAMVLVSAGSPAVGTAYAARPTTIAAPDTAVTTKFDVNGVSVILRRNTANEVVTANLYLLGGARQLTPATAGIEALLLAASERGTRLFPGATVRQRDRKSVVSTTSPLPMKSWW